MIKTNKLKQIIIILFITLFVFSLKKEIKFNNIDNNYQEVIRKVESEEEANTLAINYDLTLIEISNYNIVKYKVNKDNYEILLNNGFYSNNKYNTAYTPTDPYYEYQDELVDTTINGIWNYTLGDGVIVAIIDTGIIASNREFKNSISLLSYNSVTRQVGIDKVNDIDGHGTSVASILAANHNNNFGLAGIAPNVEIMVIKASIIDDEGDSTFRESDLLDAVYYAVDNGAHIINMSLGGKGYNQLMQDAVDYAYLNDVIVVAAAGNEGDDSIFYPASYDHVISVGATKQTREIADFSNYNIYVDICAPGVDIVNISMDNTVVIGNGTSFASPIIAGVLALYKSSYPDVSIDELITRLYSFAIDISLPGKDIYSGHGYVDAYAGYISALHKVTFLNYDGEILKEEYVATNDKATGNIIPEKPEDEGYTYEFSGWDTDFSVVTGDIIVRPIFNSVIKSYSYSFYDEDFTLLKQEIAEYNSVILAPANPTKESSEMYDYTFTSWDPIFEKGRLLTSDVLYVAVYSRSLREFIVSFYDLDDILVKDQVILYGESFTDFDLDNYQDEQYNYIFKNWDTDLTFIKNDLTVKPIFDIETRKFLVNYYDYFGELVESEVVEYGSPASKFTIDTAYDDIYKYDFLSWEQDLSFVTTNKELNPIYSREYRKFNVEFYDYFGEIFKNEIVSYLESAPFYTLDIAYDTQYEYQFIKWEQDFTNVTSDLKIYPLFNKLGREYNVSFVLMNNVIDKKVIYGETPIIDFETTITGYDFLGWNEEITPVSIDMTYTAIYSIQTFIVKFMDGNNLIEEVSVDYNDSINILPTIPIKEGYTSSYEDADLNNIKEDLEVRAIYTIIRYVVIIMLDNVEIERYLIDYGSNIENYPEVSKKEGFDIVFPQDLPFEVKENIVLNIKYDKSFFNISYADKLGVVFRSDKVFYGEKAEEYRLDDNKFIGWYLDGKVFDFNNPIYENIILKPKYKSFGCSSNSSYTWVSMFALALFIIRKRKI